VVRNFLQLFFKNLIVLKSALYLACSNGHVNIARMLLEVDGIDVNLGVSEILFLEIVLLTFYSG